MIVHLFLESADTEMSKLATAMLAKDTVSLSELRMQIRAIENSVWYKPSVSHAKLVQPNSLGNGGLGAGVSGAGGLSGSKWCGDCKARPTTQMRAGGSVPIVIDVAIDRSSVIRKKR